jgi:hypothetical protein
MFLLPAATIEQKGSHDHQENHLLRNPGR